MEHNGRAREREARKEGYERGSVSAPQNPQNLMIRIETRTRHENLQQQRLQKITKIKKN